MTGLSDLSDEDLLALYHRNDASAAMPALIAQESGGQPGILGPPTKYGRAQGRTQMLPQTAQATAARVGVPWRPEMMTGKTPEAAAYQDQLGQAYLQEGIDKTGSVQGGFKYYYGGPDPKQWGPKTEAYAQQVSARMNGQQPAPSGLAGVSDADLLAMYNGPKAAAAAARPSVRPTASARPPQAAPKASLLDNIGGYLANVERGTGIGDELNGGWRGVVNAVTGKSPVDWGHLAKAAAGVLPGGNPLAIAPNWQQSGAQAALQGGMAQQRQVEDAFAARHPLVAANARGVGMAGTMFVPGGAAAPMANASRVGNMARGAVTAGATAAGYGLADRGTLQERGQAATAAGSNPLILALGAGAGALAPATARQQAPKPPSSVQVLTDAGVALTPGQRIGGLAKSTEDLAQRAPILGTAIRGARQRGVESLNRAVANRALEPIGATVPPSVQTGNQAVAYVSDKLGAEYDRAAAMVPKVMPDEAFVANLGQIRQGISELPTDVGSQFNSILKNRMEGRLAEGPVTGTQLRDIQSQIGKIAAERSASDDGAQQALGHMLEAVSDEMKNLLGRTNPEAGQIIDKANAGWSNYVRLRSAASKAPKDGVFSPSQFSTAVRMMDRSVGKGNVAKGQAVLQDLSSASSKLMPDAFGNPGTADAIGGMALTTGMVTQPHVTIPAAAGLTAAATPYFLMARNLTSRIPVNASTRELAAADAQLASLMAKDPAVASLRALVAARLARGAGVAGASVPQARIAGR